MKTSTTFRLATMIIVGFVFATCISLADGVGNQMELKMKLGSVSQDGKDKLETITVLLKGVSESTINTDDKSITIKYNADEISDVMLQTVVQNLGYNGEITKNEKVAVATGAKDSKDKKDKKETPVKESGTGN
jgi:hypothetical protein